MSTAHSKASPNSELSRSLSVGNDDPNKMVTPPWKRPDPVKNISDATLGQISELMVLDNQCGLLVHKDKALKHVSPLQLIPAQKSRQLFTKHMKNFGQRDLIPYFRDEGVDVFYLSKNDIFIVSAHPSPESDNPISPVVRLDFLHRVYEILKECIGTVNEAYISVNRMLVFELLDEIMTFGYGFTSSYAEIKPHLSFEPIRPKIPQRDEIASRFFGINAADKSRAQIAKPKDKAPNSAYINIVEGLSAVLSGDGEMQSSELWGKLTLISTLERPAPISIQLNEDLVIRASSERRQVQIAGVTQIENPNYHACVDTSNLDSRKVLRVLPPPGQTRLMVYTLSDPACIRIPLVLIPTLTNIAGSRDQNLNLRLINLGESRTVASFVRVTVKFPSCIQRISTTKSGEGHTSHFNSEEKVAEWEMKKFRGGSECSILFRLNTSSDKTLTLPDVGPISLSFNITNFSASGLVVCMAHIEKEVAQSEYAMLQPECFFGVSTKAASYTVRTSLQKK